MKVLLSTKEVARYLGVNEKMVYTLVSDKGLPASKVTGKWLFPQHLVEQWVEANTINFPSKLGPEAYTDGLLIVAGSNDPLLEQAIGLYNGLFPDQLAVFGNLGSMGGIRALKQGLCHMATSHLLQADGDDYNFEFADQQLDHPPVVVNFCRRRQGLVLAKGNPCGISQTADLSKPGMRIVNRKLGTGTRLLLDRALTDAGIQGNHLSGYTHEVHRHIDIGLAILAGKADAGPAIQPVAELLGLDFLPWRWERYDLLIPKDRFFDPAIQNFVSLLHEKKIQDLAADFKGYDLEASGKMIFPPSSSPNEMKPNPK